MCQHHSSAAISLETKFIESVTEKAKGCQRRTDFRYEKKAPLKSYPSEKSACNRLKYVSHLLPMTLPQVKQRTGIIMVASFDFCFDCVACRMMMSASAAQLHWGMHPTSQVASQPHYRGQRQHDIPQKHVEEGRRARHLSAELIVQLHFLL